MLQDRPPVRLELRVADSLFSELFRVLDDSGRAVRLDPEERYAVFLFGSDYVVIRRCGHPDHCLAQVYATKNLQRAVSIAVTGTTEFNLAVEMMQLNIINGKGGKVGWKCAKFQSMPLAPLEVAVVIENRLSNRRSSPDDESSHG